MLALISRVFTDPNTSEFQYLYLCLQDMSFCYQCGNQLEEATPEGDTHIREVCSICCYVHYQNPKLHVSTFVVCQNKLLWLKRAYEPRAGYWTIPGGFVEQGESLHEAAAREAKEEVHIDIAPEELTLYGLGALTFLNEVHVIFRAEVTNPEISTSPEALEVLWLSEQDVPWERLAFPSTAEHTRLFYREMKSGKYGVYYGELASETSSPRAKRVI